MHLGLELEVLEQVRVDANHGPRLVSSGVNGASAGIAGESCDRLGIIDLEEGVGTLGDLEVLRLENAASHEGRAVILPTLLAVTIQLHLRRPGDLKVDLSAGTAALYRFDSSHNDRAGFLT